MSVQNLNQTTTERTESKGSLTGGAILIAIGLGLLLFKWISLEIFFPLTLGVIFILAGIINRNAGFLIPGGIIGGAGLGIMTMQYNLFGPMGTQESGGAFLAAMSLGWFSIILLTRLFTDETQVWPVFPAGAMALIGGLIMLGEAGLRVLEVLGNFWPLMLVVIGLSLLYKGWKRQK